MAVTDAMHDAAYDTAVDGALLRAVLETQGQVPSVSDGYVTTVLLLPCMAESDSRTVRNSSSSKSGAEFGGPRIIGLLVIGMLTSRDAASPLAPHHLYFADVLAAACTSGIVRTSALAQSRHLEAAAAEAVRRAHRQVFDTEAQVRQRADSGVFYCRLPFDFVRQRCILLSFALWLRASVFVISLWFRWKWRILRARA
jgi:hypothetical protein